MDDNNFCSKCGKKLDKEDSFCPNCGKKVRHEKEKIEVDKKATELSTNDVIETNNVKKKTSAGDITRYIFGVIFLLGGISNLIQGKWWCILNILLAFSMFPFVYQQIICKFVRNPKWLVVLQIALPILIFMVLMYSVPPEEIEQSNGSDESNTSIFKTESAEAKALRIVKSKLYTSYQTIISSVINPETGNYDFKIRENKDDLNAYTCAYDLQYLAKQVAGLEKVGNIEFECANSGQTFYYVSIDSLYSLTSDLVNANTKYYDSGHNSIKTSIDVLKSNVVSDYKKSCASYKYKDVLRNPDNYMGKRAYWFGEIVQVVDKSSLYSIFRIDVTCEKYSYLDGYYCNDTIYVTYYGNDSFIENDMVKMWGTMQGTQSYTTILGASVTIPKFNAKYMELQ